MNGASLQLNFDILIIDNRVLGRSNAYIMRPLAVYIIVSRRLSTDLS